jgi:hypothetical protein
MAISRGRTPSSSNSNSKSSSSNPFSKYFKPPTTQLGNVSIGKWGAQSRAPSSGGGGGGGSSGGGTSSLSSPTISATELRRRQQEEARQKEARQKAEREKQERIHSGTIAGQLETKQSRYKLDTGRDNRVETAMVPYKRVEPTDVPQAVSWGALGRNIKTFFTGSEHEYEKVLPPEPSKFNKPAFTLMKTGTISPEETPYKTITYGDIEKETLLKEDLEIRKAKTNIDKTYKSGVKDIQEEYEKGKITYEDLTKREEKLRRNLNERFQQDQKKIYDKYSKSHVKDVYKRSGGLRTTIGIGTDIAVAGASTFNPALGIGYFASKGISQLTKKPPMEDVKLDLLQAQSDLMTTGKAEKSSLYKEYKGKRVQGTLNIGIAGAYTYSKIGQTSKDILGLELEELGKSPIKVDSIVYNSPDKSMATIKGVQRSGELEKTFNIIGRVYKEGDKISIMPSGIGTGTTTGRFNWQLYKGYGSSYYGGGDVFTVGGKSIQIGSKPSSLGTYKITEGGEIIKSAGERTFFIDKSVIEPKISFGGVFDKFDKSIGAKISKNIVLGGKVQTKYGLSGAELLKQTDDVALYRTASLGKGGEISGGYQRVITKGGGGRITGVTDDILSGSKSSGGGRDLVREISRQGKQTFNTEVLRENLKSFSGEVSKSQSKTIPSSKIFGTGNVIQDIKTKTQGVQTSPLNLFRPKTDLKRKTQNLFSSRTYLGQKQSSILDTKSKMKQTPITTPKIVSKSILKEKQELVFPAITPPRTPSYFADTFQTPKPPKIPFFIPPYKPQLGGTAKRKSQRGKQPSIYQSSFTASIGGIYGKSQKLGKMGYNPFQVRGMIKETKSQSKKKTPSILKRSKTKI